MATTRRIGKARAKSRELAARAALRARQIVRSQKGQGTTEYAILVGVLVVIAILAIIVIRPQVQALWDGIVDGMGNL